MTRTRVTAADSSSFPLRVAVLDHMLELGGGELAINRLANELAPGIEMSFIVPGLGPFYDLLRRDGREVRVVALGAAREATREGISPVVDVIRHGPDLAATVARTARMIRALDVDVVYTNSLKAHVYGNLAARLARRPCITHVRDILAPPYLSERLRRAVRAFFAAVPPVALIANSSATALATPIRRRPHVIPSGVEITPVVRPLPLGGPVLALMGRLTPWKGQDVAIRAMPQLVQRFPDIRLRLAGDASVGSDSYAAELRMLAQRLGVRAHVEFCGFVRDPYAFFAGSHLVLHTSVYPEPFGQVIVEALAVGRPVVATVGGGPSEILAGGQGGILTQPHNERALAEAVVRLLDDAELFRTMVEAATRRAADYTLVRSAGLTRDLVVSVAGGDDGFRP